MGNQKSRKLGVFGRKLEGSHSLFYCYMRPPLSKKLFPVGRVGKKKASREVGNLFFFFPNCIISKLEYTGRKGKKKKFFFKIGKSSSRPFLAHPAGGQETIFYLRMA